MKFFYASAMLPHPNVGVGLAHYIIIWSHWAVAACVYGVILNVHAAVSPTSPHCTLSYILKKKKCNCNCPYKIFSSLERGLFFSRLWDNFVVITKPLKIKTYLFSKKVSLWSPSNFLFLNQKILCYEILWYDAPNLLHKSI